MLILRITYILQVLQIYWSIYMTLWHVSAWDVRYGVGLWIGSVVLRFYTLLVCAWRQMTLSGSRADREGWLPYFSADFLIISCENCWFSQISRMEGVRRGLTYQG